MKNLKTFVDTVNKMVVNQDKQRELFKELVVAMMAKELGAQGGQNQMVWDAAKALALWHAGLGQKPVPWMNHDYERRDLKKAAELLKMEMP